ncbi:MAG TPA: NADH-quinone oxidoreductase subunit NuoG [Nitrospiria bacterium]|jgi:formate dehydrogenase alpha subunit
MLVTVKIDGKEVKVEKGSLLIEAAKRAGVDVPHFCYHPKLDPDANCRMCLVEIEKIPKLQTACSTPVTDGMVVFSSKENVTKARNGVMEFILSNHPLDCPICDQGGDCQLQDTAHDYSARGRFGEEKRQFEKEYFGPFIDKEMNRCVTCLRCVRYCDEVLDVKALGPFDRGTFTQIGAFGHNELNCEFCGGCIQICPVGALTNRLPMYEYRPWELKETITICNYCGDGCELSLATRGGEVMRVTSTWGEGRNEGDLCAKGYFGYPVIHQKERLSVPSVRSEGGREEIIWEEAIPEVAGRLGRIKADYGGEAIAGMISARCTNEDLYLFQKLMRQVLQTNHVDSSARYGHMNAVLGFKKVMGLSRSTVTYEEIVGAQALLLFGADITETNSITGIKVKEAVKKHHARLISVDPFQTNISRLASHPLHLKLGADRWLIRGMIKAILEESFHDRGLEKEGARYLAQWRRLSGSLSDEELEERTGVSPRDWKEAARLYATSERAIIIFGQGITREKNGYAATMDLLDLALISGKLTAPGCGLLHLCEENNEQGALDMGVAPEFLPGGMWASEQLTRERMGKLWNCELPVFKGATFPEMLEKIDRGEIKALYLVGEDPVGTLPESYRVKEILGKLDLLICQDIFLTETGAMSHILLPAAGYAEKEGTFTNHEGYVQKVRKALEPFIDRKPDWEIFALIAQSFEAPFEYESSREIKREIMRAISGYYGERHSQASLQETVGRGVASYVTGGYEQGFSDRVVLPGYLEGNGFQLVMGQVLFHSGKLTKRSSALMQMASDPSLLIHPDDANRLGLQEGDKVRLSSPGGEVKVGVKLSEKYPPGVVFYPEHLAEKPIRNLVQYNVDSVTGVPYYHTGPIHIEKEGGL